METANKEYVRKLIKDIEEAISIILEDCSKSLETLSRAEKSEIRYYIIVLVEAIVALAYHVARRIYGLEPRTPIQTLRMLAEKGFISFNEAEDLVKLVRLRNPIVYRYWEVNDKVIYENVKSDFTCVRKLIESVRNVLRV